jgi:L-iditol 2-dehydrogenase
MHLLLAKAGGDDAGRRDWKPHITVVEPNPRRRDFALQFGADEAISPDRFQAVGRHDAVILAVGVTGLVDTALRAVRRNGKVSLFAGFDKDARVAVDPNVIHYQQITVTGAPESRRQDYRQAVSLVSRGGVDPSPLITHRFPFEAHEEAFRVAADGSALKVVFDL